MEKNTDIFAKDIAIPDIVDQRMEAAFATIRMEENMAKFRENKTGDKKSKKVQRFHQLSVAAACICILMIGGTTAYAAYRHFWSRGMQGTLQSTPTQQQTLVEEGIATVFGETESDWNQAVTDGGITVTPRTMVVNDKMVYLSLSVDGYRLAEGAEPCFEYVDVYLGDDPLAEDGWLNMGASFYDGIVPAADGTNQYDDGTPLVIDENGRLVSHYVDENGAMEYVIVAMVSDEEKSLLGKTLHVDLTNLGTVWKAEYEEDIEGRWNYTFQLSDVSSMEVIAIESEIEHTVFTVNSIELAPVAIKVNYTVTGDVKIHEDDLGIPDFCGVVLKDGTQIPYLNDGGMCGFTDDSLSRAYEISAFNRVIDTDQVAAILLRTEAGIESVELP